MAKVTPFLTRPDSIAVQVLLPPDAVDGKVQYATYNRIFAYAWKEDAPAPGPDGRTTISGLVPSTLYALRAVYSTTAGRIVNSDIVFANTLPPAPAEAGPAPTPSAQPPPIAALPTPSPAPAPPVPAPAPPPQPLTRVPSTSGEGAAPAPQTSGPDPELVRLRAFVVELTQNNKQLVADNERYGHVYACVGARGLLLCGAPVTAPTCEFCA